MLPKAKGCRRQATKDIRELVGAYSTRGLEPSKVRCQRYQVDYKNSCCPRPRVVEGELPKA